MILVARQSAGCANHNLCAASVALVKIALATFGFWAFWLLARPIWDLGQSPTPTPRPYLAVVSANSLSALLCVADLLLAS